MHQDKIFEFYSTGSPHSLTLILPVHRTTDLGRKGFLPRPLSRLSPVRGQVPWEELCAKGFGCLLLACAFVTLHPTHFRG